MLTTMHSRTQEHKQNENRTKNKSFTNSEKQMKIIIGFNSVIFFNFLHTPANVQHGVLPFYFPTRSN